MSNRNEQQLKRAREQRFKALQNAYNTIDAFAEPSLEPEMFEKYEQSKNAVIEKYRETDE
jgi:hypothetical protein